MRKTQNDQTIARLCDSVERLVDLHRSMMFEQMAFNKKMLDRALSVADWALSVRRIEQEVELNGKKPPGWVESEPPVFSGRFAHQNGDVPDIVIDPNNPHV